MFWMTTTVPQLVGHYDPRTSPIRKRLKTTGLLSKFNKVRNYTKDTMLTASVANQRADFHLNGWGFCGAAEEEASDGKQLSVRVHPLVSGVFTRVAIAHSEILKPPSKVRDKICFAKSRKGRRLSLTAHFFRSLEIITEQELWYLLFSVIFTFPILQSRHHMA